MDRPTAAPDPTLFRRVMGRFATGVTVITAEDDGGVRGMTANAFMSGSLTPPLCIISVSKKAKLHGTLEASRHFGVSMLAQGQEAISRHFAGQGPTEPDLLFEHMADVPVLANVCAALTAEVEARHDCGDHSLFVGRVLALRDDERPPLVFHAGKYATLHYKTTRAPEAAIDFWELDHGADSF
jgi:flavin reductase (DIM6/NTAB) family NADH-FMN oxidoreductase RutF